MTARHIPDNQIAPPERTANGTGARRYQPMPGDVVSHNPDVEPERSGYCIHNANHGWWWNDTRGWMEGRHNATVFTDKARAMRAAKVLGGAELTTPPRFNGHVIEWRVIPVESVDDGWVAA